jgi:hypothetical protein
MASGFSPPLLYDWALKLSAVTAPTAHVYKEMSAALGIRSDWGDHPMDSGSAEPY